MKYLHTMLRISDIDESLEFFCGALGLEKPRRYENEAGRTDMTEADMKAEFDAYMSYTHEVKEKGLTLVPLRLYFKNGRAKVEIALARGKRAHDKRETIKKRESDRELARAMRGRRRGS